MTSVFYLIFSFYLLKVISCRIIGGADSQIEQFPFAVALLHHSQNSIERHLFGGSLLNDEWILTSGECLDPEGMIIAYLGNPNIHDPSTLSIMVMGPYVKHPDYNALTLENNLGLVKLPHRLRFNNRIKPIDSLGFQRLSNYATITVVGWGQTNDNNVSFSEHLHYVSLDTIDNNQCLSTFGDQIKNSMICAVSFDNKGICKGDAGGPAVQILSSGTIVQVAIASFFKNNECESLHPSVFQRTFEYEEWILSVVGKIGHHEEDDDTDNGEEDTDENNNTTDNSTDVPNDNDNNNDDETNDDDDEEKIIDGNKNESSQAIPSLFLFILMLLPINLR